MLPGSGSGSGSGSGLQVRIRVRLTALPRQLRAVEVVELVVADDADRRARRLAQRRQRQLGMPRHGCMTHESRPARVGEPSDPDLRVPPTPRLTELPLTYVSEAEGGV